MTRGAAQSVNVCPAYHREQCSYLVDGVNDPVDSAVLSDGLVRWVDQDDLKVLVCAVLVDPVRVEDSQIGASFADTLLSSRSQRSLVLELVDTLVGRLACILLIVLVYRGLVYRTECSTLSAGPLATTSADSDSVDDIALLSFVSQSSSLIWSSWAACAVDDIQLSELYYALSANVQRVYSKTQKMCHIQQGRSRRDSSLTVLCLCVYVHLFLSHRSEIILPPSIALAEGIGGHLTASSCEVPRRT